jgi:hypothetical protein
MHTDVILAHFSDFANIRPHPCHNRGRFWAAARFIGRPFAKLIWFDSLGGVDIGDTRVSVIAAAANAAVLIGAAWMVLQNDSG